MISPLGFRQACTSYSGEERKANSGEGGTYLMFNTLFVHPAADAPVATQGVILSRRWFPCR